MWIILEFLFFHKNRKLKIFFQGRKINFFFENVIYFYLCHNKFTSWKFVKAFFVKILWFTLHKKMSNWILIKFAYFFSFFLHEIKPKILILCFIFVQKINWQNTHKHTHASPTKFIIIIHLLLIYICVMSLLNPQITIIPQICVMMMMLINVDR